MYVCLSFSPYFSFLSMINFSWLFLTSYFFLSKLGCICSTPVPKFSHLGLPKSSTSFSSTMLLSVYFGFFYSSWSFFLSISLIILLVYLLMSSSSLWYFRRCYSLCQVDFLPVLPYHHLLRLLYLRCRLRLWCSLFQFLNLQFIYCPHLASLAHLCLPEFDCCRIWKSLHQLFYSPATIQKWNFCSLLLDVIRWYITPIPSWLLRDQLVTHPKCRYASYYHYTKIWIRILQSHPMPLTQFMGCSLFS